MDRPDAPASGPSALRGEVLAAVVLLVLLLHYLAPALGAVPAWIGLLLVLWPIRHETWAGRTLLAATFLLVAWAVGSLQLVLAPFLTALLLAYVLDPVVDALERIRLPRAVASGLLLLVVGALAGLVFVVVLPPAIEGMGDLLGEANQAGHALVDLVRPWLSRLPSDRAEALAQEVLPQLGGWLQRVGTTLLQGVGSVGRGLSAAGQVVSFVVITPVLLFYLLVDIDRMRDGAVALVPRAHRPGVTAFLAELDGLVAAYFRGQVIVSLVVGVLTAVLLVVLEVPHGVAIGIGSGLLNLVPIVGFWLGLLLALLATLMGVTPVWPTLLWVGVGYVAIQQLEGQLLSPRIVGKEVGLPPVAILMGIVIFGSLFGLVGVLVAVPLTAMSRMVATRLVARYRRSAAFGDSDPDVPGTAPDDAPTQ